MSKDDIYATPLTRITDFAFDEKVAQVFPDMIKRSVPGYATLVNMIGVLAGEQAQAGSRLYDLGCSLGAVTLSMARCLPASGDYHLLAIDNSQAMLDQAQQNLASFTSPHAIEFLCADLREVEIENASVVVLNFTLQFIPLAERDAIIRRIYEGLRPGGVLILSEKIQLPEMQNQHYIDWHHAFKKANGYSELEISQKRSALENVLQPETREAHQSRLQQAGFETVYDWYQCLNFASYLAMK